MDLNSLIILTKVVEHGSFTAGAAALNLPKSLVSQRISRLEGDLGLRLLYRTTRHLSVTDEGQAILKMATDIGERVADIQAFAEHSAETPHGLLRITAPHDLGIYVIREVLPSFQQSYPEVEFELDLTSRYVDLVDEGFDLALRAVRGGRNLADSTNVAKKLSDTALRFYAHKDFSPIPKKLAQMENQPVISFRHPNRKRKTKIELQRGNKTATIEVKGPLRTSDMLGCKHAVVAGMGIGLLPEFVVAPELKTGELILVLPEWEAQPATFYAVYPSRRHLSSKAKHFIDFLQRVLDGESICRT